jgi:hypothetical protein
MRGQHRDDCRAHRALRPKGACPACTRATQHVSPASLGCQATASRSKVVLFTCRLLCLQVVSYADDPAAGDLITGANFDVLNFAMVQVVVPCAAGRRRLRGELRGEPGRGRQPLPRGMWPASPMATAGAQCARPQTMCMRTFTLYYPCTTERTPTAPAEPGTLCATCHHVSACACHVSQS